MQPQLPTPHAPPKEVSRRNLVFVCGKGGVGKTAISKGLAMSLAKQLERTSGKVLWVTFEDPVFGDVSEMQMIGSCLWHLNVEAGAAFEEYVGLKVGFSAITRIFVQNKLIRYLAKAAPGMRELVLLGKVWHESENFDHVICDMPSTGYGLAMFQSTANFARLFKGGPIHQDTESMLETFGDPHQVGHLILALAEEMPLRESLELAEFLSRHFPGNPPAFILNKAFPRIPPLGRGGPSADPDQWPSPLPSSTRDYALKRSLREAFNLKIWEDAGIRYSSLPLFTEETREKTEKEIQKKLAAL